MIVIYKPKAASFVSLISSALFLSIFVAEKRSSLPFLSRGFVLPRRSVSSELLFVPWLVLGPDCFVMLYTLCTM